MFDFIHKSEYCSWWDSGHADHKHWHLKGIQDAWIKSEIGNSTGLRICEVGGRNPRILKALLKNNECWNADRYEGQPIDPIGIRFFNKANATLRGKPPIQRNPIQRVKSIKKINTAPVLLGEFSPLLPDNYFDIVFSISVLEHVVDDDLHNCFKDMTRILKPGGRMLHAIDLYLKDEPCIMPRCDQYRNIHELEDVDLRWEQEPKIPDMIAFQCAYATNSDQQMAKWNHSVPALRPLREIAQCCSIKAAWCKPK